MGSHATIFILIGLFLRLNGEQYSSSKSSSIGTNPSFFVAGRDDDGIISLLLSLTGQTRNLRNVIDFIIFDAMEMI